MYKGDGFTFIKIYLKDFFLDIYTQKNSEEWLYLAVGENEDKLLTIKSIPIKWTCVYVIDTSPLCHFFLCFSTMIAIAEAVSPQISILLIYTLLNAQTPPINAPRTTTTILDFFL